MYKVAGQWQQRYAACGFAVTTEQSGGLPGKAGKLRRCACYGMFANVGEDRLIRCLATKAVVWRCQRGDKT